MEDTAHQLHSMAMCMDVQAQSGWAQSQQGSISVFANVTQPFNHFYEGCVGSGHATLTLRYVHHVHKRCCCFACECGGVGLPGYGAVNFLFIFLLFSVTFGTGA